MDNPYLIKKYAMVALLAGTGMKDDTELVSAIVQHTGYDPQNPTPEVEVWQARRILELIAARVLPGEDLQESMRKLGRLSFEGYGNSAAGKILLAVIKAWGTVRLVKNSPLVYQGIFRYGERSAKELEPNRWELLHFDEPGYIEFMAGITEAVVAASGAQNIRLDIEKIEDESKRDNYRFELNWE
ncbi:MAG: DUF2378 family protein [Chloroflexi bacterium]|uniref:DUF2378 family protein n=1 Tax=Candidatus Chlorohelix allophototropha TaxID=3003348 RepID=A0A8T7M9W3_9CHLR|nr:DUF2378 family protein [Chloroflexota bacterium]WJW68861.1 DUF2378 family protein [Chloroflexota bacterium L227-S17]